MRVPSGVGTSKTVLMRSATAILIDGAVESICAIIHPYDFVFYSSGVSLELT